MLTRMTLKMWRNYNARHKNRVLEHQQKGELNYQSSDESPVLQNSIIRKVSDGERDDIEEENKSGGDSKEINYQKGNIITVSPIN